MREKDARGGGVDPRLEPCAASVAHGASSRLGSALDDAEGDRVPDGLPPVLDAHVHLFSRSMFDALYRWFDRHGWPVRHKLYADEVVRFLGARGVHRLVALHYAHKPGIARTMNRAMAELAAAHPAIVPTATVLPGELEAEQILDEAFALGLRGVKLHCHVQGIAIDDARMRPLFALAAEHDRPVVVHAGREPRSDAYPRDPHEICAAERTERVLLDHPRLRLCVPHLGADEFDGYARLLERHDNLWLDTTMALADYLPMTPPPTILQVRPDRLLYGTDFPILPYAWDRELLRLERWGFRDEALAGLLSGNARDLYRLEAA